MKRVLKRGIQSEKGSSSILVAMVLIMLVIFGLLAISTSGSGLRLAMKNADTVKVWYNLDSEGQKFVFSINSLLMDCVSKADGAVMQNKSEPWVDLGLSEEAVKSLKSTNRLRHKEPGLLRERLILLLLQQSIHETLPECVIEVLSDDGQLVRVESPDQINQSFQVRRSFALDNGDVSKFLNITLKISAPAQGEGLDKAVQTLEWRLWQEPFEYKNQVDLWEGNP